MIVLAVGFSLSGLSLSGCVGNSPPDPNRKFLDTRWAHNKQTTHMFDDDDDDSGPQHHGHGGKGGGKGHKH